MLIFTTKRISLFLGCKFIRKIDIRKTKRGVLNEYVMISLRICLQTSEKTRYIFHKFVPLWRTNRRILF